MPYIIKGEEMNNILEVRNISKSYSSRSEKNQKNKVVDNISFEVKENSIVGLVGESGCGKTTLGKIITGLIKEDSGEIIYRPKERNKKIQMIFQDPYSSLNSKVKILNIIRRAMRKNNIDKIDSKSMDILKLCGISEELVNRYPFQLSGGQRQRVGIARALSVEPELIICDEPTASLDVSIQSQILNLILYLKSDFELTYLFISHDLNVVRDISDEIIVMYLGEIVEKASAKDIINSPLHPYTELLLNSIPKSHPKEIKKPREIVNNKKTTDGCKFYSRCKRATENCFINKPKLRKIGTRFVACNNIKGRKYE